MLPYRPLVLGPKPLPQVRSRTFAFSHVQPSKHHDDQNHHGGEHNQLRIQQIQIHRNLPASRMSTKPNLLTKFPSRMAYRTHQAALRPETTVTGSTALAVRGFDASIFIC